VELCSGVQRQALVGLQCARHAVIPDPNACVCACHTGPERCSLLLLLLQVLVPLVHAVVNEAAGASGGQGPAGKGKAGLFIMLAVLLRTRPQVRHPQALWHCVNVRLSVFTVTHHHTLPYSAGSLSCPL
jgi:hypothetical protein